MKENFRSKYHSALKIALIYLIISAIYIVFSDRLILFILQDTVSNETLSRIQSFKGLTFVLLTSVILFWLIFREIKIQRSIILKLEKQKEKLTHLSKESEKARQSLYERNVYIETILKNLPIGLVVNKINEGAAIYMNPKFNEIYGWPKKDLKDLGSFFSKIFPNKVYRKKITKQIMADVESGIADRMHWKEVEIVTGKGEKKIVNVQNIQVYDQNLMISIVEDVTEKKQLENEREMFFDYSIDLLSIADFDGYLKNVNLAWIKTLGWSEEELLSRPWTDFVHPDDLENTTRVAANIMDGHTAIFFKNRYKTKDGNYRWLSWNAIPRREENLVFSVARDITDEIKTIEQLEFQKNLNQSVFDTAEVGLRVTNEEGEFIQVNKAYCNIYGFSLNELPGEKITKLLPKNQHQSAMEKYRKMIENKTAVSPKTIQLTDHRGNVLDILVSARVFEVNQKKYQITSVHDVTTMKRIQRELERSKEHLQSVTDNLPGAIIRFEFIPDDTISLTYVSQGIKKIWGISPEDVIANNQLLWENIDKNQIKKVRKSIEKSFKNLTIWNAEWKSKLPDKEVKWFQGIGTPHKLSDGTTIMNSVILDVNSRKEAESVIKKYQKSLQNLTTEISLLEEKHRKEVAANIHDHLSQSLVISKMKLSDLQKNTELNAYQKELESISNHISQALENSRKITYDLSPPVLYELGLIETMYWLSDKVMEENQLRLNFTTEFDTLDLSDSELIIIFRSIQEIINNTIKYAKAENIDIHFNRTGKGLEIHIRDDGRGFDVSKLETISQTNTGFGLFAVKERVKNLNGTFSIVSEPGVGTEVKIYVPLFVPNKHKNGNKGTASRRS